MDKELKNLEFNGILQRFKLLMGLETDTEVANVLGLKQSTFSERKKRNSFPVKALKTFVENDKEKRIKDLRWVLTGSLEGHQRTYPLQIADVADRLDEMDSYHQKVIIDLINRMYTDYVELNHLKICEVDERLKNENKCRGITRKSKPRSPHERNFESEKEDKAFFDYLNGGSHRRTCLFDDDYFNSDINY